MWTRHPRRPSPASACKTSQWSQETTERKVWGPGAWGPHSHLTAPVTSFPFPPGPLRGSAPGGWVLGGTFRGDSGVHSPEGGGVFPSGRGGHKAPLFRAEMSNPGPWRRASEPESGSARGSGTLPGLVTGQARTPTYLPRARRLCEGPSARPSPAGHTERPRTRGCGGRPPERLAAGEKRTRVED